jgi:hypothetical protein
MNQIPQPEQKNVGCRNVTWKRLCRGVYMTAQLQRGQREPIPQQQKAFDPTTAKGFRSHNSKRLSIPQQQKASQARGALTRSLS